MPKHYVNADDMLAEIRQLQPALVSFDLFDTLVFRTLGQPNDAFRIQGRRLEALGLVTLSPAEWLTVRKRTERRIALAKAPGEVQLGEIYDALLQGGTFKTARESDDAMAVELEIEREVIRFHEDTPRLLRDTKQSGARVVVLSDTYLPGDFIRELLAPVEDHIDEVICSSELQRTKRLGHAFAALRDRGEALHFGDNPRSDVSRAKRGGVTGRLVVRGREGWVNHHVPELELLRDLGCEVLPLEDAERLPAEGSLQDLGFRWGIILFDYLVQLRAHARAVGATDVWLSSRDCETIWAALQHRLDFFGDIAVRYVQASRIATHSLTGAFAPERYVRWFGHSPSAETCATGQLAKAYYRAQLRPETRRVVFADMTSKGRIEISLREAMPPEVSIIGYYFSLQPGHEASPEAGEYLPWLDSAMIACPIEMLAGYAQGSCIGFQQANGAVEPALAAETLDAAPRSYLASLEETLRFLIDADPDCATEPAAVTHRRELVQRLTVFPDSHAAKSISSWKFVSRSDRAPYEIGRPPVSLFRKVTVTPSQDNRWPTLAVHSVLPGWAASLMQRFAWLRLRIKDRSRKA